MDEHLAKTLARFKVDPCFGFLIKVRPEEFPLKYRPWVTICENFPQIIVEDRVGEEVEKLPELEINELLTHEDFRYAHLLLVTITSGYLWSKGKEEVPGILPRSVALPLLAVSSHLGVSPVVTHATTCLANWKLIDPKRDFCPENLQLLAFKFFEHPGNDWFFIVTAQIEKDFAKAICNIVHATSLNAMDEVCDSQMATALLEIPKAVELGIASFKKMKERLPAAFFYHELRKFLWGYNQGKLAETGIVFEGAEDLGPLKYDGASAAQSSIVSLIDAFLGIRHEGADDKFLKEQRHCMIKEHRQLIEWVERFTPVKEHCKHRAEATAAISKFRTHHLTVVAYYILSQLPPDSKALATGTGGTPFMTFLKNLRNDCQ